MSNVSKILSDAISVVRQHSLYPRIQGNKVEVGTRAATVPVVRRGAVDRDQLADSASRHRLY